MDANDKFELQMIRRHWLRWRKTAKEMTKKLKEEMQAALNQERDFDLASNFSSDSLQKNRGSALRDQTWSNFSLGSFSSHLSPKSPAQRLNCDGSKSVDKRKAPSKFLFDSIDLDTVGSKAANSIILEGDDENSIVNQVIEKEKQTPEVAVIATAPGKATKPLQLMSLSSSSNALKTLSNLLSAAKVVAFNTSGRVLTSFQSLTTPVGSAKQSRSIHDQTLNDNNSNMKESVDKAVSKFNMSDKQDDILNIPTSSTTLNNSIDVNTAQSKILEDIPVKVTTEVASVQGNDATMVKHIFNNVEQAKPVDGERPSSPGSVLARSNLTISVPCSNNLGKL